MTDTQKQKKEKFSFGNELVVLFLKALSFLPFCLLFLLSDLLYLLLINVLKYRFNVTTDNLKHSLPEKSEDEIGTIRDKFYKHFCDLTLESIKLYRMNKKQMSKRLIFKNPEVLNKYTESGRGAIVLAMHYNNWEWCSAGQLQLSHKILMVYNRMRNNTPMDNFLLHSRSKWGGEAVVMSSAARSAIRYAKNNEPVILWLAADQAALDDAQFWTTFLNREAAFFSGPAKMAKRLNQPVFFQHVRKLARGKYELEMELLIEEPARFTHKEILLSYVRKMEEVVRTQPEYYLWTHKRWKHKRPDGIELTQ